MALPQRVRIAEQLIRQLEWDDLDRAAIRRFVDMARDEVLRGHGLLPLAETPARPFENPRTSRTRVVRIDLVASDDFIACGTEFGPIVMTAFGCKGGARPRARDGTRVTAGSVLATLEGPGGVLIPAVSTYLGFLRRLSGIATRTRLHVDALGRGRTRLLDSGPTTPGWRAIEKYAIASGGAWNSGDGSADRVTFTADSCTHEALALRVRRARESMPDIPIEVTVSGAGFVEAAIGSSPDVVRLEGFSLAGLRRVISAVKGGIFLEARGGITLKNLRRHGGLGLDFIAVPDLVSAALWSPIDCRWHD